jgi:hypothetical protein
MPPVNESGSTRPFGARSDDPSSNGYNPTGLVDLLRELRDESTTLVRQELALFKAEMSEKAAHAGRHGALLGIGGAALLLGAACLLAAVAWGLSAAFIAAGMSPHHAAWLGWLIVGVIVCGAGGVVFYRGLAAIKAISPLPEQTLASLKESKQWLAGKIG